MREACSKSCSKMRSNIKNQSSLKSILNANNSQDHT